MRKAALYVLLAFMSVTTWCQTLKLKSRNARAISGTAFAEKISAKNLSLKKREKIIFREIKKGNIPDFLRKLVQLTDTLLVNNQQHVVSYWVLADYLSIGSDEDFFYCPMTPMLAQRIANLTSSSLPTRKIVNKIYEHASVKLKPQPIPPDASMTTVPVFLKHTQQVRQQMQEMRNRAGQLTAGNKKDIIISNKIYGEPTARVVIYGWHKDIGAPLQPLYNKHTNTWVDYSHGIRLIQNEVLVDGMPSTYQDILKNWEINRLFSDEGQILQPYYPISKYTILQ